MTLLAAAALLSCLAQDKTVTHGKTNAQILAMGRTRWYDFYTGKEGMSTAGMTSAEGLYGDALAWRNDRLVARSGQKAFALRLRNLLQDTKNEAVAVGSAISGGGTMWNPIASGLHATAEETLYAVLTKTGKAPKRKVSHVEMAYAKLRLDLRSAEGVYAEVGRPALLRLRKDLDGVIGEAKRLPRRESDALLDFCVKAMGAGS